MVIRPSLASAMSTWKNSTEAHTLSVNVSSQASLLVGTGPRGNMWDRIALRSFSEMSKRSACLLYTSRCV